METTMQTLADADWNQLEKDVVIRIRALAAMAKNIGSPGTNKMSDMIANDLILPNVKLLAEFCASVSLGEENPNTKELNNE